MNMRIGGLVSGMDIDQIVEDLMKAGRMKVDTVEQDKEILEWKQAAYNEVNKAYANFIMDTKKDFGLTQTSATGSLINSSVSSLSWVKTAGAANNDIAEVSAFATAVKGSYYLNVTQLAKSWSAASSTTISTGDTSDLASQFGLETTDTVNFTIITNEGAVTIDKTGLDGVTLSDVVNEINAANIGVTAIYDDGLDRFFLQTTNTGSENTIKIEDNSTLAGGGKFITGANNILKMQYLDENNVSQDIVDGNNYAGQDALLDFGAASGITQSSNSFSINNINITLKDTGATTLNVTTNVSAVYEKISNFVESYNDIIDKINTGLSEKKYTDYKPLTDEQREAMTDEQIEQWEEKAKSGLLRNDSTIDRTLQSIRLGMYQKVSGVDGVYDQLTEIGITTETYSSGSMGGKLVIDRVELTEAIENDVDSVLELMFKSPSDELRTKAESQMTSKELEQKRRESGLVNRLYDNIISGMKNVVARAGTGDNAELYRSVSSSILIDFVTEYSSISMLDRDIVDYTEKIDELNADLNDLQDRYWRQFTAMEKALDRMNQQSMWLTQQFAQNG